MCSRLGANAPKNFIAIAIVDKDIEGVYNNRTSKNRGVGVNKNTIRIFFVCWVIVVVCWVFLRIGTDIHKTRKFDEAMERASEQEKKEQDLEKLRQKFREKWGEEPTF